jgi:hypothetical protein
LAVQAMIEADVDCHHRLVRDPPWKRTAHQRSRYSLRQWIRYRPKPLQGLAPFLFQASRLPARLPLVWDGIGADPSVPGAGPIDQRTEVTSLGSVEELSAQRAWKHSEGARARLPENPDSGEVSAAGPATGRLVLPKAGSLLEAAGSE